MGAFNYVDCFSSSKVHVYNQLLSVSPVVVFDWNSLAEGANISSCEFVTIVLPWFMMYTVYITFHYKHCTHMVDLTIQFLVSSQCYSFVKAILAMFSALLFRNLLHKAHDIYRYIAISVLTENQINKSLVANLMINELSIVVKVSNQWEIYFDQN